MNACKKTRGKITQKATSYKSHSEKVKEPTRNKPSIVAINENHKYSAFLTCKLLFQNQVWEIAQEFQTDLHSQSAAPGTLLKVNEAYLVSLFEDTYTCVIHIKYVTIMPNDILPAQLICGECV